MKTSSTSSKRSLTVEIYGLLESVSRTLVTNKSEMMAILEQWKALAEGEKGDPEYPKALGRALKLLEKAPNLRAFLAELKAKEAEARTRLVHG
jgi:hypothetical protein